MRKLLLCLLIILSMTRFQRSWEIQVYQPFLAPSKKNYVRTTLCDLGAKVSVMSFSLYKRLYLDKSIPTDISWQIADKSTDVPIGICENVSVQVANNYLILTDFVVLETT